MKIELNSVVSVTYELRIDDELGEKELLETVEEDNPMVFLYGMSGLPEKFEEELQGMQVGDTFEFSISPEEGYGEFDPEAIVELPMSIFAIDGETDEEMLQVGNFIPMTDAEGNRMQGRVVAVDNENVQMDFNHPLVGKYMYFIGQIVGVRIATSEEIAHGHVHGPEGHQH